MSTQSPAQMHSPDGLSLVAHDIRETAVRMCVRRGQGYAGQALALADLMAHLFFRAIRRTPDGQLDRFVLSTGHSAIALFAVLGRLGVYTDEELSYYGMPGSRIEESPLGGTPGFEITGGSLGQGLSQAVGMAIGERLKGNDITIYCLVSDGELQEGQIWEAVMAAGHHHLGNLVVLIDNNRMQADGDTAAVMTVEPVAQKFEAFGFDAVSIDGNDHAELFEAIPLGGTPHSRPLAVVCETLPGKGVPSFERYRKVHYIRAAADVWETALRELEAGRPDQPEIR
jgi:transketolase